MEQDFIRRLVEGRTTTVRVSNDESMSSSACFKALKKTFKVRELTARGRLEYFSQAVDIVNQTPPAGWDGMDERIEEMEVMLQAATDICQSTTFGEIQTVLATRFNAQWIHSSMASRSLSSKALRQIARSKLFELALEDTP